MAESTNMLGKTFGLLKVIEPVDSPNGNTREKWYHCKCQCGNFVNVRGTSLRSGTTKSCGCLCSELTRIRNAEYAAAHNNLTGKRFHRLVAIEVLPDRRYGQRVWRCRCDCGNIHDVAQYHLINGGVKSCGCLPTNTPADISGKRFGRLTVTELTDERKSNGAAVWKCLCDCGTYVNVSSGNLKRGITVSCGCIRRDNLIGMRFGKLTVEKLGAKSNHGNGSYWICKCDCGNISEVHACKLKSGHTSSCGCSHANLIRDLSGQRFGKITVLCDSGERRKTSGGVLWKCRCDCGQEKLIRQDSLLSGNTFSCGCTNSRGNTKISQILRDSNISFIPEYSPDNMKRKYRFDFAVISKTEIKYFIEYDGALHFSYSGSGWDTEERYNRTNKSDSAKNEYCTQNGIPLIRVPYTAFDELSVYDLLPETTKYLYRHKE